MNNLVYQSETLRKSIKTSDYKPNSNNIKYINVPQEVHTRIDEVEANLKDKYNSNVIPSEIDYYPVDLTVTDAFKIYSFTQYSKRFSA